MVFPATLAVYLLFPTHNYYWDGVAFALHIEHPDWFGESMVTPNHLVYVPFGRAVYVGLNRLGVAAPALATLQGINSLAGAASVALLCRVLLGLTQSGSLSLFLSLLFAFSATWWKFATDANAYVISVLFLLIAFALATRAGQPASARAALAHTAAMLFHQLAVFFFPVALLGLFTARGKSQWRAAAIYSLLAAALTLGAYSAGYMVKHGEWDLAGFLGWITYHTPDSSFSFDFGRNLLATLRGHLRLFLGGKVSLFRDFTSTAAAALAVAASLAFIALWPRISSAASEAGGERKRTAIMAVAWAGVYVVFLFFWLPQNTFYRLFYLPALVVLAALIPEWRPGRRSAALLAAGILWNFLFFVHPHSRVESNLPLQFALSMRKDWPKGSIIYLGSFHADAWLMWYLHPQTIWKVVGAGDLRGLENELRAVYAQGGKAWADTSLVTTLAAEPAGRNWLAAHTLTGAERAQGRIQFVQLFPAAAP